VASSVTSLTVNGQQVDIDRPDDTALLTVLRDALGRVGSRFTVPPTTLPDAGQRRGSFPASDPRTSQAHVPIAPSCELTH
jgi:hypothetical protein